MLWDCLLIVENMPKMGFCKDYQLYWLSYLPVAAAALVKAHKSSCQLTQILTEQLQNLMFTPFMSLMLISVVLTRISTISTCFLLIATCNAVLWWRERNYIGKTETITCTFSVHWKYRLVNMIHLILQSQDTNSLVSRPPPSFTLLAVPSPALRTASDGKLGGGLGTRLGH